MSEVGQFRRANSLPDPAAFPITNLAGKTAITLKNTVNAMRIPQHYSYLADSNRLLVLGL
jgi:hypothetical protein